MRGEEDRHDCLHGTLYWPQVTSSFSHRVRLNLRQMKHALDPWCDINVFCAKLCPDFRYNVDPWGVLSATWSNPNRNLDWQLSMAMQGANMTFHLCCVVKVVRQTRRDLPRLQGGCVWLYPTSLTEENSGQPLLRYQKSTGRKRGIFKKHQPSSRPTAGNERTPAQSELDGPFFVSAWKSRKKMLHEVLLVWMFTRKSPDGLQSNICYFDASLSIL